MRTTSITLGSGVTGASAWLPLDPYPDADLSGLFLRFASTGTATLEVTPDDVFNPAVTPFAYALGAPFVAATTSQVGALGFSVKAIRINAAANATGITLTVVTSGGV